MRVGGVGLVIGATVPRGAVVPVAPLGGRVGSVAAGSVESVTTLRVTRVRSAGRVVATVRRGASVTRGPVALVEGGPLLGGVPPLVGSVVVTLGVRTPLICVPPPHEQHNKFATKSGVSKLPQVSGRAS